MRPARRSGRGRDPAPPFSVSAREGSAPPGNSDASENVDNDNRNPMFLFRLFGLFLLRAEQRAFLASLLKAPPRNTPRSFEPGPATPGAEPGSCQLQSFPTFFQPPRSRPTSATILATCSYCPPESHPHCWARRR